jgi:RNA polymerase sigma factor (sigma-70 family)
MTEAELIQGCLKNDRRCQNALYKQYFPLMSSIAMRYCGDRETSVQHINYGFLKVLQNLDRYKPEFALATWIRHILTNHIIDELRKTVKDHKNMRIEASALPETENHFNEGEQKLLADNLLMLLNKLPRMSRIVFTMHAIDGYKHKEIAERLDISEGSSKWYVSDARSKLIAFLHANDLRDETTIKLAR